MKFETLEKTSIGGVTLTRLVSNKAAVSTIALMTAFAAVSPAWATIDNTVTATGSSPGNTDDVTNTADETVDVEDAAAALVVVKTVVDDATGLPLGADIPAGTVVRYEFAVENTGNVNVSNVNINEVSFDGDTSADPTDATVTTDTVDTSTPARTAETTNDSTDGSAGDGIFDTLAPGDIITFTSTYTVTAGDVADQGGGDGTLDNEANASGVAPIVGGGLGPVTSPNDTASFDLENAAPLLSVTKIADDDTDVVVGQIITYTYVVSNDGNVPITEVTLSDNVTAGSGTAPVPTLVTLTNTSGNSSDDAADNDVDVLAPGDTATFTGTYVVTQDDIDNLQ